MASRLNKYTVFCYTGKENPALMLCSWPRTEHIRRTVVEVEALGTAAHARVGALAQMVAGPARRALVAAAADAGLARRRALLAAFLVVAEKAAGALRHAGPGEGRKLKGEERKTDVGGGCAGVCVCIYGW